MNDGITRGFPNRGGQRCKIEDSPADIKKTEKQE